MNNKKKYIIHKRFYVFVALVIILVIALCVHFLGGGALSSKTAGKSGTQTESTAKKKAASASQPPDISGIKELPASYTSPVKKSSHAGTLHEFRYNVKINGRTYKQPAIVYLPAGYKSSKKYDIFYLMHGYGGTYHTFLGWWKGPRLFKFILDHMIATGKIKPTIVVDVEYNPMYGEYYYGQLDNVSKEVVKNLAPAVEKKYSTYAKTTTLKGLEASRAHRAIGGFSMGGCATWRALKNYPDVFQYYLPISLAMYYNPGGYVPERSKESAKIMADAVKEKAPGKKVYIFAASGTADFMNQGTEMQARDLAKRSGFKWVDPSGSFRQGNITFNSWLEHTHTYTDTYPYLYNGLIRFFGTDKDE